MEYYSIVKERAVKGKGRREGAQRKMNFRALFFLCMWRGVWAPEERHRENEQTRGCCVTQVSKNYQIGATKFQIKILCFHFNPRLRICFMDFRERERKGERLRNINVRDRYQSVASCMCPNQGSNPQPFTVYGMTLQSTKQPGQDSVFTF